MASLESDRVDTALEHKLGCEVDRKKRDHNYFFVKENNVVLARTKISKGSKHTLSETLVTLMARQLQLGVAGNLVKFVNCTLDRDGCLAIIRASSGARAPTAAAQASPASKPSAGQSYNKPKSPQKK